MNKTLIAAAVSAAVAAPVASADITVYGRVNNAIDLSDLSAVPNSEATTHLSSVASRFGLKGSTDLGNGLTVHGKYEFGTVSDRESTGDDRHSPTDVRVASAGVSGSFGRIDVGNLWSAYNKTFGTLVSPTYTLGYYLYSSVGGGAFRASNTIQYSNSWGPVGAVLDIRLNDDASPESGTEAEKLSGDGWGLGVTYQVTPSVKLTAAYDVEDTYAEAVTGGDFTSENVVDNNILATFDPMETTVSVDETRFGIAGTWNIGSSGYWVSAGWQTFEQDRAAVSIQPDDASINFGDTAAAPTGAIADTDNEYNGVAIANAATDDPAPFVIDSPEDISTYFVYGGGPIGQKTTWLLGYASGDNGLDSQISGLGIGDDSTNLRSSLVATDDANQLVWGLYHNVGGGLKFYYEAISLENENRAEAQDGERHLLGIRVDF